MKVLPPVAKLAVTAGLLWLILRSIGLRQLIGLLNEADPFLVAVGLLQLALQPPISAVRWWVVIRRLGAPLSFWVAVKLTYIGTFFSQALPAVVGGDAIRIWLAHRTGCPLRAVINSVILDRIAMLLGLIIAVAWARPWLAEYAGMAKLTLLAPIMLTAAVGGIVAVSLGDQLPHRMQHWRAVRLIVQLAYSMRAVFLHWQTCCPILILSLLAYVNMTTSIYLFGLALGQSVSFFDYLILVPPVLFASSLPISIGGWGTREFAMVGALGLVGVAPAVAILVSTMFGIAGILVTLPGAAAYLACRDRPGDVRGDTGAEKLAVPSGRKT
jgi:glycosyltransferase 2 family protein